MKNIHTLIPDIHHYIETNEDWYDRVSDDYIQQIRRKPHSTGDGLPRRGLRLSGLGDRCPRALWYMVHHPELAESLPAAAHFKYGYGHIIEAMALSLARLAGHSVEGEQDELVVDDIVGHRDAVIDGCIVDVKSCSSISFNKIKAGLLAESDDFGYLYQLDGYILGSQNDPLCTVKDRGYILAIDKTLGHFYLYEHQIREESIRSRIRYYRSTVDLPTAPACECQTRAFDRKGTRCLDTKASYSQYKHLCFPKLRTVFVKDKPFYLV